jgi:hypothetical protein
VRSSCAASINALPVVACIISKEDLKDKRILTDLKLRASMVQLVTANIIARNEDMMLGDNFNGVQIVRDLNSAIRIR